MPLTIGSNRNFGIEIECLGITQQLALNAMEEAGLSVAIEGYGHSRVGYWKIVPDGSLSSGGFEVVSPVLSGSNGLDHVEKAASSLMRAGARVDRTCGFHVHVDAAGLTGLDVINVVQRYVNHETVIDSFMPRSRRGNSNQFCVGPSQYLESFTELPPNPTARYVAGLVGNRYCKLNICSYTRHGTLEFRQHGGTIDSRKMINWIIFCVNFLEHSRIPTTSCSGSRSINERLGVPITARSMVAQSNAFGNALSEAVEMPDNSGADRQASATGLLLSQREQLRHGANSAIAMGRLRSNSVLPKLRSLASELDRLRGTHPSPYYNAHSSSRLSRSAICANLGIDRTEVSSYISRLNRILPTNIRIKRVRGGFYLFSLSGIPEDFSAEMYVNVEICRQARIPVAITIDAHPVSAPNVPELFQQQIESRQSSPETNARGPSGYEDPGLFFGLDAEVVSYFSERIQDFADR